MTLWTVIFIVAVSQGLFLLAMFLSSRWSNVPAARILAALLAAAVITDADYLVIASGWYRQFPWSVGVSFGMMLLFGPLLYQYAKALLIPGSPVPWQEWWHYLPFALYKVATLPFMFVSREFKLAFIEAFVLGTLPLRTFDLAVFVFQTVHMAVYLLAVVRLLGAESSVKPGLAVPIDARRNWLKLLLGCFSVFLVAIMAILAYVAWRQTYTSEANYIFAFILSAIIFVVSWTFATRRELVAPNHTGRYSSPPVPDETRRSHIDRLNQVIAAACLDPDLTLGTLADLAGMPPHVLSRLINEQYGRNFFDFINGYRIEEVKRRIIDPGSAHLSILGVAMECGFNTKSSFNTAFRKHTGLTPSEYRRTAGKSGQTPD